jgi:hypothetical protein
MNRLLILTICTILVACSANEKKEKASTAATEEKNSYVNFKSWAETPPMGWNSYNCFGAAVAEAEVKANADVMAGKLKQYGWEYIVVDYCWSYPHPLGSIQNNPPQFRLEKDGAYVPWLAMDEFGRLLPDLRKFPSSTGNMGFKPLGDYIHSLELKFGIHVMRGIPRQAVWAKSPIKGTSGIDASMIADTTSTCPWLNQMFGVNMKAPGAQEYYNSIVDLYASWGVDYIKMDDMNQAQGKGYFAEEAEAMHKAILQCGRPIVLSLSPFMSYDNKDHIRSVSNLWRISKDFWDDWESLKQQFELADQWNAERESGSWPDADMLQLGRISRRGPGGPERESNFTRDEQMTHMFFWCIMKSPLMMGGDMTVNTPFVDSLLTNSEILDANQHGINPRRISGDQGKIIWYSGIPDSKDLYVAFFNLNDRQETISLSFDRLGLTEECKVHDLWYHRDRNPAGKELMETLQPHSARMYRISPKN